LDQYIKDYPRPAEALETSHTAFAEYVSSKLPRLPRDLKPEQWEIESTKAYGHILDGGTRTNEGAPGNVEAKIKMHLSTLKSASEALSTISKDANAMPPEIFYGKVGDVLLPYLDSKYGGDIKRDDYGIFTKLTRHWEHHFKEDIRTLNCLPPTILTRVTEYIPENVAFVERLVEKGFAYTTSDGSVYFDISAFEKAGNSYARLEPWNRNDQDLQADGEGSLTQKTTEKKSNADFALWKSSKPGEPSWNSPWGQGRPGWHIECSVMCSDVLGRQIDIHSGGIDLAFPHHDNELAQSEAYWVEDGHQHQWVNYFLHMGHLSIQGSKMSKSLKNFTTIREALSRGGGWTARGLRIVFLLGGWKDRIEITEDVIAAGKSWENGINVSPSSSSKLVVQARTHTYRNSSPTFEHYSQKQSRKSNQEIKWSYTSGIKSRQ
jgi:cysteinyl-tRNA synthetase